MKHPFFLLIILILASCDGEDDPQKLVEETIRPREEDLKMSLPEEDKNNAKAPPLLLKVSPQGHITAITGKKATRLDTDLRSKNLPKLDQFLTDYIQAAQKTKLTPAVQINAAPATPQTHVINIINLLTKHNISKVTFADLVE